MAGKKQQLTTHFAHINPHYSLANIQELECFLLSSYGNRLEVQLEKASPAIENVYMKNPSTLLRASHFTPTSRAVRSATLLINELRSLRDGQYAFVGPDLRLVLFVDEFMIFTTVSSCDHSCMYQNYSGIHHHDPLGFFEKVVNRIK